MSKALLAFKGALTICAMILIIYIWCFIIGLGYTIITDYSMPDNIPDMCITYPIRGLVITVITIFLVVVIGCFISKEFPKLYNFLVKLGEQS